MDSVFTEPFVTALVSGGLLAGVPLLFAALGETISERAGVLNIGLEGMMLLGAYTGFLATYYSSWVWGGLGAGLVGGLLVAVAMAFFCVRLGMDQIVIGIALTLLMEGLTSLLQVAQFSTSYPRLDDAGAWAIPMLNRIPVLGDSLFTQHPVVYIGLGLVVVTAWMLRYTTIGLRLRAAGEKPEAVDAAGVSVEATRIGAVLTCGALAGVGGAYISIVGAGIFTPFLTNGAGFIAIVMAMLARGKPLWVVAGALLFGMSLSLTTALQLAGIQIQTDLVQMLPFLVVIVTLVLFGRRAYLPTALGVPYVRGSR